MNNIKNNDNLSQRQKDLSFLLNQLMELVEINTLEKILNQKSLKNKTLTKKLKR